MGLVRCQVDDDFGIALTQKTVEIGIVGARTEVLLGRSCPLFNLVTDSNQGRLVVQAVELRKIDTLCHLTTSHHSNIYGAHGATPPLPSLAHRHRGSHSGTRSDSQAGAHGVLQDPIPDQLNAGLANMVGQLRPLKGDMVCHSEGPVGRHGAQLGGIAGRVHEEAGQPW